jgi:hypothetical protein
VPDNWKEEEVATRSLLEKSAEPREVEVLKLYTLDPSVVNEPNRDLGLADELIRLAIYSFVRNNIDPIYIIPIIPIIQQS